MNTELDKYNQVIVNFSSLLMGSKSRLPLTEESEEWEHYPMYVSRLSSSSNPDIAFIMGLSRTGEKLAELKQMGSNGMEWIIDWKAVRQMAEQPLNDYKVFALSGMCRLMILGRDRFRRLSNGNYRLQRLKRKNKNADEAS